jgi:hypothetical protein
MMASVKTKTVKVVEVQLTVEEAFKLKNILSTSLELEDLYDELLDSLSYEGREYS